MMLPDTDRDGTHRAAERLRRAIAAAPFTVGPETVEMTVSVGWADWRGEDPSEFKLRVERSLRQAREAGGDVVRPRPRRASPAQPLRQPPHPERLGRLRAALAVRRRVGHRVHLDLHQRRDLLERAQLRRLLDQRAPHRRLLADRAEDRVLEVALALEDVGRGLLADALRARQAVGGVAAQGDEVGHELGADAVALAHLLRAHLGEALARLLHQHVHLVGDALEHVAVAGEDQRAAAPALLGERERVQGRRPRARRGRAPSTRTPRRTPRACAHWTARPSGIGGRWAW